MQNSTPENLILLCGELITDATFLYTKNEEDFFEFSMKVTLPSGTDILPVIIADSQIDDTVIKGATLSITGKLISEEIEVGEDRDLIIKVLVNEVYSGETEITSGVFLTGNVIKKPYSFIIKDTERAEFQIAVGSENTPIAYIPVSVIGENTAIAKRLQLGDTISILGQLHSFEYLDLSDLATASKTAYEVEILTFTAIDNI